MTKYLLNLVCIIGIAGAAHGAPVVGLEITPEGHAYLVFTSEGTGELAGYSIEADPASGVTFLTGGTILDGTGEFGDGWVSLDTQHVFAGEDYGMIPGPPADPDGWFAQGIGNVIDPDTLIADFNIDGFLSRPASAPVYIGKILDNGGTPFDAGDFLAGGRLDSVTLTLKAIDDDSNIETGTVGLFTRTPLVAATYTDLNNAGTKAWQETGDIGVVGTHLDFTNVGAAITVLDLECTGSTFDGADTYTSTYTGHVMIDGTLTPVTYAELTETTHDGTPTGDITASYLQLSAVEDNTSVSIDLHLTQSGKDVYGHWGTIDDGTDEMVVIPEPTTMTLLVLGALAVLRRHRNRSKTRQGRCTAVPCSPAQEGRL